MLLDGFEDGYRRQYVWVSAANDGSKPCEVLVYIAEDQTAPLPNAQYKRHLIDGARHWRLPQHYCEMLETIEAAPVPGSAAFSRQQ
jgi:hypothetical protein